MDMSLKGTFDKDLEKWKRYSALLQDQTWINLLGFIVCEGVGPICLGHKLVTFYSNNIFGILSPIFLCFFCQERLYNIKLYVLLMYLAASRDYSKEDRCNPLLLIAEF